MAGEDKEPTELSLKIAMAAFKNDGGALLRAELERRAVAREVAYERQISFLQDSHLKKLKDLEARHQRKLQDKKLCALVEQACIRLCVEKAEAHEEEAIFYAKVVKSFQDAAEIKQDDGGVEGALLTVAGFLSALKTGRTTAMKSSLGRYRGLGKSLYTITEPELKKLITDVQGTLKKDGVDVPYQKLNSAVAKHVKVKVDRSNTTEFLKDCGKTVMEAVAVVQTVVTTVSAVRDLNLSKDVAPEPVFNCRHSLPEGWFF